ncbi:hypothetical protein BJY52DRAFT_1381749 [Lactarius psammicola]|nr:hypothetical protein BJY52DRAFT_1381749 [Lactarius psammicola]
MSSSPTLVSQEHKPINDKQEGKAGKGKGNQATAAQPAEAATYVPANKSVPSTTDSGKTSDVTSPEEVAVTSELNKDPAPPSTATTALVDATPAPPVPEKNPAPKKDATVTKQHPPTSEPAASSSAKPEAQNAPDADAEKASETPGQIEAPSVVLT